MFLRWENGRQGGGYSKMALLPTWLSRRLKADAYLICIPANTTIVKHKDPVTEGYKHYRMNVIIRRGIGRMFILGPITRYGGRIDIFRPDLYEHGLQPAPADIWMISFGCLIKD